MQYRDLGATGIRVSLISLGTGGPSQFGQNTNLNESERKRLIDIALDSGINFFDTAEGYGESEILLGIALKGIQKSRYYIGTKWNYKDGDIWRSPEDLKSSVERSLKRLNLVALDVMQFHGITPHDYDTVVDRYYPTIERMRIDGKIRFIGFTQMLIKDPKLIVVKDALTKHPDMWDTVMLKYGILNQWAAREVFDLAKKNHVGILNMAPIRFTLTRPEEQKKLFKQWRNDGSVDVSGLNKDRPFDWLLHDEIDSIISAGYKFAAINPAISTVITGTSNVEHLKANIQSLEHPFMPERDYKRLIHLFGSSNAPN